MNTAVRVATKKLGFCCPFAYFRATIKEKRIVVASELSVSEETVKVWRRKLRDNKLSCRHTSTCLLTFHNSEELLHTCCRKSFELA